MEGSKKVFIKITNQQIYEKMCNLEDKFDLTLNGNGKKGLREIIGGLCLNVKIHNVVIIALLIAAIKTLFFP